MKLKEIFFKASRKMSETCPECRKIIKRGDLDEDFYSRSDDIISIWTDNGIDRIDIDCDKKTGEFRLFFTRK